MSSPAKNKSPHNILFIPSGSIGDALMMLGLCGEIIDYQPDAKVTIIARRNGVLIKDLARAYPRIQVHVIQKDIHGAWTLVWESFRRPYTALMPAAFGLSAVWNTELFFKILSWRPGTVTAGLLKKEGDQSPYQRSEVYTLSILHFDSLRRLARLGGLEVAPEGSTVSLKLATQTPQRFLDISKKYIVFHPFGSSSWKSWPPRRSKELLAWLRSAYPQLPIVVTAANENEAEAKEITQGIANTEVLVNLPVLELAGVIQHSGVYIGVDTGITHLTGVLNAKSVVMAHLTGPSWLPKYNPNAKILINDENCACDGNKGGNCRIDVDGKPYLRCLYDIKDEWIQRAVGDFLPPIQ